MKLADKDDQSLLDKARSCTGRVSSVEHRGQIFWVKSQEDLTLRMRFQKGSGASGLRRERAALHRLADTQAPVARIVEEEPAFIVIPDYGPSLERILRERDEMNTEQRERAFADGAVALARLHSEGLSHGRPSLKDICWKNGRAILIDFENYSDSLNSVQGHARDLLCFFFSGLTVAGRPVRELEIARDAYRAKDTGDVWSAAQALSRRLRWLDWATKPIQMRRPGKAREFKAIPMTLDWFRS